MRYVGLAGLICGLALCADEAWKTKDPSQWTGDDVNKILNDSPWAKRVKVSFDRSSMSDQGRSGRSGGGGTWGGGGIGFPGGGMGRRGGMGGGQRRPGAQSIPPVEVVLRWDSAKPVQEALARHPDQIQLEDSQADRAKASSAPAETNSSYVIAVLGLRMPERRGRRSDDTDDDRTPDNKDPDHLRDRLMGSTRLVIKGHGDIRPSDIKVNTEYGNSDIRFYFPRTNAISLDDKEVTFESHPSGMKLEQKFHVKDMQYQGKLAL